MADTPKKSASELMIIYIIIALVVIGIVVTRKKWQPILGRLTGGQGRIAALPQNIVYNWHNMNVENSGFSFDTPVDLKPKMIKLPDYVKPMIKQMATYGFASRNLSIDAVFVTYTDRINPSLAGAESGAIQNVKKAPYVKDFKYKSTKVNVSGKEGSKLEGSFNARGLKMEFNAVMAVDGRTLYQVISVYDATDAKARDAAEKISSSAKIEKKS